MTFITTYSGHRLDFLNPHPAQIDIQDISRGLSRLCRFSGQTNEFYSVAEHCCILSEFVEEHSDFDNKLSLQALLHDAPEAYIGDIPAPIKKFLPDYQELEARLWKAIAEKFDLPIELDFRIKTWDKEFCYLEGAQLMPYPDWWREQTRFGMHLPIRNMSSDNAYKTFMSRFKRYTNA